MDIRAAYFSGVMGQEFFDTIVGEQLGVGISRTVHATKSWMGNDKVIKFEYGIQKFQNTREWLVWKAWEDNEDVSPWLAPCYEVSPCGCTLIQARTWKMRPDDVPEKIPAWATDLKAENWGMFEGRPVIHDYGHVVTSLSRVGKLVKPKWSSLT